MSLLLVYVFNCLFLVFEKLVMVFVDDSKKCYGVHYVELCSMIV